MDMFVPFYTNDGSVGLYSESNSDIYHSVYGAFSEATNKFILPADFTNYFINNKEIKILDLCYGIGYNTKSFFKYFFEKVIPVTENIETIYTNNVEQTKYSGSIDVNNIVKKKYNNSIHVNNIFRKKNKFEYIKNFKNYKIHVDAVDLDKNLMFLAPFFATAKNKRISLTGIKAVDKYLSVDNKIQNCFSKNYFENEINMLLIYSLFANYDAETLKSVIESFYKDKKYSKFLNKASRRFFEFYYSEQYKLSSNKFNLRFLHNIYYKYLSNSYKNVLNILKNNEIDINCINEDARHYLKNCSECYDFIFLDGFTPAKCPNLWTYEFFNLLYNHLSDNGKILTYSNSSSVRNAMIKNNFYISKIFNEAEKKYTGTIAVKNKDLITQNMTQYDYGLLNTTAGIMYRDKDLSLSNEEIISIRKSEVDKSELISTTSYKKNFKGEIYAI